MAENITNNQKFTGIVVDDGSVRESIRNRHGDEIGVFYFRPTDVGMVDRYNKMAADFDKITAPLENVNINPDGTVDEKNEAEMNAMREAEKNLFEACVLAPTLTKHLAHFAITSSSIPLTKINLFLYGKRHTALLLRQLYMGSKKDPLDKSINL